MTDYIDLTTMTMQFINNQPDGIRICRVEGESLVTIVIPRDQLAEVKGLPQLPLRGIYYLLDEDHGVLSKVYAGQTIQGISRLESHKSNKDFWNKAVMFLDEDWNIDRDVLDSVEAKAIEYVRSHGSYETDNVATPNPRISPYKMRHVDSLHSSILFRMKILGYDLDRKEVAQIIGGVLFRTKKHGVHATGRYDSERGRFIVLTGSEVDLDRPVIKNQSALEARKRLFGSQTGKVTLNEDIEFASPSMAAVFVLGGSQNGWAEWMNDQGQTLDYVYRNKGYANE